MWRKDTKCKYMFIFPLKNLARKGLSHSQIHAPGELSRCVTNLVCYNESPPKCNNDCKEGNPSITVLVMDMLYSFPWWTFWEWQAISYKWQHSSSRDDNFGFRIDETNQTRVEQLAHLPSEDTPLLPHDYTYYWFILNPKSKQDRVKVTNLKNLPKLQWEVFTCDTSSEVAW